MALNVSGQISIGGAVVGQSINLELGVSGTAAASLNDTALRTLAGVASGAIALSNFYGKSNGPTVGVYYGGWVTGVSATRLNTVTRINTCGAIIGAETTLTSASARGFAGGANMCTSAMFYGGGSSCFATTPSNVRINKCGAQIGAQVSIADGVTTESGNGGSKIGLVATYMHGRGCCNVLIRFNSCSALLSNNQTFFSASSGFGRTRISGSGIAVGANGIFYAGVQSCTPSGVNSSTRVNACGAAVGAVTNIGTSRGEHAGAKVGNNALFYAGITCINCNLIVARVSRINQCNALAGAETTIGTARRGIAGSLVGAIGVFYAGLTTVSVNTVTRINACGAIVGTQGAAGTARYTPGGASL